jgi:predicted alpha/beta-fold hydrolase
MFATLVLIFAVVISSVFVLVSAIRWLFTGQKPTLVFYAQAYQRWKHMAKSNHYSKYPDESVIDAEVREIPQQPSQINRKKDADQ